MFSELQHYPSAHTEVRATDPVPPTVGREWRGYQRQAVENAMLYTKINYDPAVQATIPEQTYGSSSSAAMQRSSNRHLYHKRPIVPYMRGQHAYVLQQPGTQQAVKSDDQTVAAAAVHNRFDTRNPATRTVGTLTDYRESETQTDPYTPEYLVRPGEQPELLTLAQLSYGRGLPAGLAEVEMIERAREKRQWEACLPALDDIDRLPERQRMMEEQELREWRYREEEIEKIQAERYAIIEDAVRRRTELSKKDVQERLEHAWEEKQLKKKPKIEKMQREAVKQLRKLTRKRANVQGRLSRTELIDQYSNPASSIFAPPARLGLCHDRSAHQFVIESEVLRSYHGLLDLEYNLPASVTQPRIKRPQKFGPYSGGGYQGRRNEKLQATLKNFDDAINHHIKEETSEKPLRFLIKVEKPPERPATPEVRAPVEDEEKYRSVLLLQQLIRGRKEQNLMYEGKEARKELIAELRTTHALRKAEIDEKLAERQDLFDRRAAEKAQAHAAAVGASVVTDVQAGHVGKTLDFLSKELVRLQEERRIHAFAMLAERQRRMREAEESGRRQKEEIRRREMDAVFKQVVGVHQETVESYLEDIIIGAVNDASDDQARKEIRKQADKINAVAQDLHERGVSGQFQKAESIVSDLVSSFLLPEVEKQTMREKVKKDQRKYLQAAHKTIKSQIEDSKIQVRSHKKQFDADGNEILNDGGVLLKDGSKRLSNGNIILAEETNAKVEVEKADVKIKEGAEADVKAKEEADTTAKEQATNKGIELTEAKDNEIGEGSVGSITA
eukprot:UC4_evm3s712